MFSVFTLSTSNVYAKKINVTSEKKVKKVIHKYAKDVSVKSVKGSILGIDGDTVQITLKGKENLTDKMTVKGSYQDICMVYNALKKANISNFKNIGIAEKIDGKYIVKTDTTPDKLSATTKNDLKYKYNDLPSYTTHFWQLASLPKLN